MLEAKGVPSSFGMMKTLNEYFSISDNGKDCSSCLVGVSYVFSSCKN